MNKKNMNKKGFTLIELLAVIVILAIIALIATPIILNMINDARKSASVDSAYGYIEAVEYNNSMNMLDSKKYPKIEDGENIDIKTIVDKVKLKGTRPSSGTITVKKGLITQASLCINNYNIEYDGKEAKVNGTCGGSLGGIPGGGEDLNIITLKDYCKDNICEKGTVVYMNPETNRLCSIDDYLSNFEIYDQSSIAVNISNKTSTGLKTGCMKWYVITTDDSAAKGEVSLITDHNTSGVVEWTSDTSDVTYPKKEVKDQLDEDTKKWNSGLNIRLISSTEIANIIGIDWDVETYDTSNGTNDIPSQYSWLYVNTYNNSDDENVYSAGTKSSLNLPSPSFGYYTNDNMSTTKCPGCAGNVWVVYNKKLTYKSVTSGNPNGMGVRPVITINKSITS